MGGDCDGALHHRGCILRCGQDGHQSGAGGDVLYDDGNGGCRAHNQLRDDHRGDGHQGDGHAGWQRRVVRRHGGSGKCVPVLLLAGDEHAGHPGHHDFKRDADHWRGGSTQYERRCQPRELQPAHLRFGWRGAHVLERQRHDPANQVLHTFGGHAHTGKHAQPRRIGPRLFSHAGMGHALAHAVFDRHWPCGLACIHVGLDGDEDRCRHDQQLHHQERHGPERRRDLRQQRLCHCVQRHLGLFFKPADRHGWDAGKRNGPCNHR